MGNFAELIEAQKKVIEAQKTLIEHLKAQIEAMSELLLQQGIIV